MAPTVYDSTHPTPIHYSFIDPESWPGWLPVADGLPTVVLQLVATHQLQVECGTGKVHRPETDVLPLCNTTNYNWAHSMGP